MPSSRLEKSITSYAFRTGKPLLLNPSAFDELIARDEVELVGTKTASWLGVPLKTSNEIIGVIAAQDYETPNHYTEHDLEFPAFIGAQIALGVVRIRT